MMRESFPNKPIWDIVKLLYFGTKDKIPTDVMKTGIDARHKNKGPYGDAWYFFYTV